MERQADHAVISAHTSRVLNGQEAMTLADKLRPHVTAIQSAAAAGDHGAQQVVTLYQMHVRCPADPGAPALCEAAFDEWITRRNQTEEKTP